MIRVYGDVLQAANVIHLEGVRCEVSDGSLILIADRRDTRAAANALHIEGHPLPRALVVGERSWHSGQLLF